MFLSLRNAILHSVALLIASAAPINTSTASHLHVTDIQGNTVSQLAPRSTRVVVLLFTATDCPISKRYIPEIARLQQEFSSRGVAFWWVFPNPGDTAAVVRKHELDFSIHTATMQSATMQSATMQSTTLIDTRQELVHLAHVSVTPEAAVFAVNGSDLREIYHGRIDDRYLSFSKYRPAATRHDLEDAIKAALAGNPVTLPTAQPVGCSIVPLNLQP